jgi:hypothetical protein
LSGIACGLSACAAAVMNDPINVSGY